MGAVIKCLNFSVFNEKGLGRAGIFPSSLETRGWRGSVHSQVVTRTHGGIYLRRQIFFFFFLFCCVGFIFSVTNQMSIELE